ncbi:purine permease [Salinisphaera sp. USBA-960]|uniref:nucleobase:cation symporter-2 family protein n=1 Tax=Salinisphaera orenii TaxID=856731 RepID=UPI000DBEAAE9|nr:purine permease [Salifodinibacter halophilus]NNC26515.1 purine permease [Salifodinibacter halophilus]
MVASQDQLTTKAEADNDAAGTRPEDRRLSPGLGIAYGLQHVLTMYAGLLAVPLIMAQAAGLSDASAAYLITATFFMAGLATLLQTLGAPYLGAQLPLVQGTSFAAVATMVAIAGNAGGLQAVFGAVMVAALVGIGIAPIFSRVIRFFPPVVTGSVITIIGISLLPVATHWAMGGDESAADYGSLHNIGLAAATLAIALFFSKVGSGAISRLSFLLAIIAGTGIATIFGLADFSSVTTSSVFSLPKPLHFGLPTFNIAAIISMVIVMLVILTETSADMIAVGEIIGTDISSRRVANGLRADMTASLVSPFFGSFPMSAFAQNIGLVAVTGIKSRYAVAIGGGLLVVMGLFPIIGNVITSLPLAVLGGAGLILFGTVAASGIRTLASVDYRDNMNLIIVAVSVGVGLIPIASPHFYDNFPDWFQTIFHSGISATALVALVLNLLFNHLRFGTPESPSVFAAGTDREIHQDVADALEEGDHCENGRIYDADGHEIPVTSNEDNQQVAVGNNDNEGAYVDSWQQTQSG